MKKLPADNPWRDQELNLPVQGRQANHTDTKGTEEGFSVGLDPKLGGLSVTLGDLAVGGHKERRTLMEDLSWFHVAAQPSAAQRNTGQGGRFQAEDEASTLPVLDLSGALVTKVCMSLLSSGLLSSYIDMSDP